MEGKTVLKEHFLPHPLALVTGASSGIGSELARELARDGHDLILVARREMPMLNLAQDLAAGGVKVTVIPANLGVINTASRLAADLRSRGIHGIDVLVNNAGFGDYMEFTRAEPTKLAEMIQLNVIALTELAREFLPGMVARGRGRVLLVGALAGFSPGPGAAVYHATKAYVHSLGQALDRELRGSGVTVTTLCPGPTDSGFSVAAGREPASPFSWPRLMTPAEVARRAYEALKEGRRMQVPGLANKIRAAWQRFAPRFL
jgi:short-subunit dehydrogenase